MVPPGGRHQNDDIEFVQIDLKRLDRSGNIVFNFSFHNLRRFAVFLRIRIDRFHAKELGARHVRNTFREALRMPRLRRSFAEAALADGAEIAAAAAAAPHAVRKLRLLSFRFDKPLSISKSSFMMVSVYSIEGAWIGCR